MNIILLGPPGSGKGTQSSHLAKKYSLNHLSTGDVLRSEIVSGSKLGKEASKYMNEGNLVPDEVIIGMAIPIMTSSGTKFPSFIYLLASFPSLEPETISDLNTSPVER